MSTDAARAVLGAVIINPACYHEVRSMVGPSDFPGPHDEALMDAFESLAGRGDPIDTLTVSNELAKLHKTKLFDVVGGDSVYLMELGRDCPSTANVTHYARLVKEASLRRQLAAISTEMKFSLDTETPPEQVRADALKRLSSIDSTDGEETHLGSRLSEVWSTIEDRAKNPASSAIPTGIEAYDSVIGGLKPEELVIVAARPGVGKTSFARRLALSASDAGFPTMFFSYEMSYQEMSESFIAAKARASARDISRGGLDYAAYKKVYAQSARFATSPLHIDTRTDYANRAFAKARSFAARHGKLGMIVFDYIGLMRTEGRAERRDLVVGDIAKGAKWLAKDTGWVVVLLSQLNRNVEHRSQDGGPRAEPRLSDLRESGEIEQHANVVLFVHREQQTPDEPARLIVGKNRNGPTGAFEMQWKGEWMSFENVEPFAGQ